MAEVVHIMTHFAGIGGCESHAVTLATLLQQQTTAHLWADLPTPAAQQHGAQILSPFAGKIPRGGNLLLLGTHLHLGPWIDHVRPKRLIVMCVLSNPVQAYAMLTQLDRTTLPAAELLFVSQRLQQTIRLPGKVCPEPLDLQRFVPRSRPAGASFTLGRHSRDIIDKHHPDDPALYRRLAWIGLKIHLMGATCLHPATAATPNLVIQPAGSQPAERFLQGLDCFFYRTGAWAEPSGRVVMEALACGLPAIVHENGGYTDWIEPGRNGHVFSTQEEAHDLLLQLAQAPTQRHKMAQAARQSAERLAGGPHLADYLDWLSA